MDPVLEAVAAALAGKAVAVVADGGRSAWSALVRLVREQFTDDQTAEDVFDAASREPGDAAKVERLGEELARAEQDDPRFGQRLRELWAQAGGGVTAESGGVVNKVSGSVTGHVVQARDITGGVVFGQIPGGGEQQ